MSLAALGTGLPMGRGRHFAQNVRGVKMGKLEIGFELGLFFSESWFLGRGWGKLALFCIINS